MKKAALGAALGWPGGQIPVVGGTITRDHDEGHARR